MSEETQGAAIAGPISIISTILAGFAVGFFYLLSLLFSIQDPANVGFRATAALSLPTYWLLTHCLLVGHD